MFLTAQFSNKSKILLSWAMHETIVVLFE
ncbi:hypothetical protein Mgra_00004600 [Meloidogyne graminicola]|uniref:Uncharacterized protein n=1 Tax=Meloidogyne graminicola TaxID=189291 RepID=A0A8S9ZSA3_9BILA|nr:hypothetical protein Mgra_00004600 [Meloidogyne graminicola]